MVNIIPEWVVVKPSRQSKRPPPSSARSRQQQQQQQQQPGRNTRKPKEHTKRKNDQNAKINPALLRHFEAILSTFHDTFAHLFTPALPSLIQDVKQSLYLRDYVAAFDSPEKLQAYVVRWSVARALAYCEMISSGWLSQEVTESFIQQSNNRLKIACIGGGAGAELVGIAAVQSFLNPKGSTVDDNEENSSQDISNVRGLDLTLLDFATWTPIIDSLYGHLTDPAKQSKLYVDKSNFTVSCHQQDVLSSLSEATVAAMTSADIVTILFTAGELYSQSPTSTTKFIMSLHALTKPGALLVIVDSAGGFEELDVLKKGSGSSTVESSSSSSMGGYKLGFLLDKTLTSRQQWETITSQDAKWWRVPQELRDSNAYPLELENMRSLIRVYRRNNDD
ncbi:hypothetical protein H072_1196 [Dactylellina haptotyla CBS 200.50]|uniref:25S rRNA (Uridine(2843)-N(3))-methyltransferase n=1 Tax=Dactylellina haptotyla (strain CBS 200.50) TaxID=1284197 RepID=S8AV80_DACHA|nr:hypothetical protein H072_1196 [Dactylellina haptotyla CBS 200.50]